MLASTDPPLQAPSPRTARWLGALVGFGVAGLFVAAGFQVLLGQPIAGASLFWQQGVPTLVAGTVGGWMLAPRAGRASTRRAWLGVILRLAILTVVLGSLGVGLALGFETAIRDQTETVLIVPIGIAYGLFLGALGIGFLGLFVLPLTLLAAVVWASVMGLLRPVAGRRSSGRA